MKSLYHYTIGIKLDAIYYSGVLAPSPVERPELPVLWLSANALYEPSAAKAGFVPGGRPRVLSLEEMAMHGGGVFRFEIDPARYRLYQWPRLAARAHIPAQVRQILLRRAEECGAKPIDWYGCLTPIPITDTPLQQRTAGGQWLAVDYHAVAEQARNPRTLQVRGSAVGLDIPSGEFRPGPAAPTP